MTTNTLQGRRVFYYFLMFFVFIILINAVMVTIAIRSHTGLVTDHPYEKGLAYNTVVDAANAQAALGWKAAISFNKDVLHVTLNEAEGKLLTPQQIKVEFTRPTQAGMDFSATMIPTKEGGFTLTPMFPAKGLWEARIYTSIDGKPFQQSKRIVVQ